PTGVEDDRVRRLEPQVEVGLRHADGLVLERVVDAGHIRADADPVDPRAPSRDHEPLLRADGSDADPSARTVDHELSPQIVPAGRPVADLQAIAVRRSLGLTRVAPRVVDVETAVALHVALLLEEQPVRPRSGYGERTLDVHILVEVLRHPRASSPMSRV